jgi:tRNA modification GTPase
VTSTGTDDTIVAMATAPGRAALAIVRMSGPRSLEIGRLHVRPWPDKPRQATLSRVYDANGELLDEVIAVVYESPQSFTGEDALEVTTHGGSIAPAIIVAAFAGSGARPAEPGEFTRRAVLNGKMDLLQAEAVGDLTDAHTRPAQRTALAQLDGGLSRRIAQLRSDILGLEALAAYDIDFPEEDDGPIPSSRIVESSDRVLQDIDQLLATAAVGELVREGAVVVIAGAPNVGKSSLFNAILGRRRAIVADAPGTTRDALEAVIEANGWPVRLIDTAGLRDASESVERLGIEVSREYLERADVVVVCGDSADSVNRAQEVVASLTPAPRIPVRTKSDLIPKAEHRTNGSPALFVSAESGEGITGVVSAVGAAISASNGSLSFDAPLVTRERHRFALQQARDELRAFRDAFSEKAVPASVAAVHLREATRHLEELIGVIDVEDILDRVFRTFCVGK